MSHPRVRFSGGSGERASSGGDDRSGTLRRRRRRSRPARSRYRSRRRARLDLAVEREAEGGRGHVVHAAAVRDARVRVMSLASVNVPIALTTVSEPWNVDLKLNWPVCGSIGAETMLAGPSPQGESVPEKKKQLTTCPADI